LLHGHPQNHLTWCKVAPRFARRYSVVAPDLRGSVIPANRRAGRITSIIRSPAKHPAACDTADH
jgi:pimeloyl-ACP methyl ester carboxylesterase